jgi:nucleotide-binding universal stress UspA family protein
MASNSPPPVVVGVDGSPSSLGALDYAAEWAVRHRTPLRIVHALVPPRVVAPYSVAPVLEPDGDTRTAVDAWLRELAGKARREHPNLTGIQAVSATGHPAALLIEQSRQAAATVVGCRGLGGFAELMLGSTSAHLATHGHGPIVIVPTEQRRHSPSGPVLACYDGSPAAEAALRFAADEAALRGVPMTVAYVFGGDGPAAKQLLTDAVDPWADEHTGAHIELRPIHSEHDPQYALLEASHNAALTVVGSRGRSGLASLLLGSVSRYLIHNAYGPVAVIHPAEHRKEGQ